MFESQRKLLLNQIEIDIQMRLVQSILSWIGVRWGWMLIELSTRSSVLFVYY